jgi:hypothetical protein
MANPRIEIEIGAVIDGLRKGFGESVSIIKTLKDEADRLEKALENATDLDTIGRLNVELAKTRTALSQLRTTGVEPLTKATANYNAVGIDFARIIQDAPFGIIGVGNNITQLAQSFGDLRSQTGSTSDALKTAFASIFSSGNALILGISALTTAFTILQQKGFFDTKEAAKSLKDQLDEYKESLDSISRASIEGSINAQKEIQNLKLLRAQAENTNLSLEKRLQAVTELQKQAPEYLGNLTKEQLLTGQVGDAYNKLNESLLATARARAASGQIIKNFEQILLLEKQQIDNAQEIANQRDLIARLEASSANTAVNALRVQGQFTAQNNELVDAQNKLNELINTQVERVTQLNSLSTENKRLQENINTEFSKGATFTSGQLKDLQGVKRTLEDISQLEASLEIARLERRGQFFEGVEAPLSLSSGFAETQGIIEPKVKAVTSALEEQKVTLDELSASFAGLGSLLGQVFGNNPALGSFLSQFVGFAAKLIATNFTIASSNAAVGASSAAVATGPAAPFTLPAFLASSLGLIAGAFAAFGGRKSAPSIGTSGVGGGSGSAFAGGAVGGLFNQNREIRGELVARGQDLVYVFNEANTRINKG